ncbi:MAG: alpha/beta hydrolase [Frankia sp.]|nr:alpha/beta hydrolase [Frankia sp.]
MTPSGPETFFVEAGEGDPAVVLLHGAMCDHRFMQPQFDHFRASHRTIAIDLPGHGESPALYGGHGNDVYADHIARLCSRLNLSQPVVIGHSTGGNAALSLADRHPEVPAAVVLLEAGPLRWPDEEQASLRALVTQLRGADGAAVLREVAGSMFESNDDFTNRGELLDGFRRASPSVFADIIESDLVWDGRAAAASCAVPTLLVVADRPSMDVAEFVGLLPTAIVGRTVGSGHFHQLVVPDQVNAMIDRFLERVSR